MIPVRVQGVSRAPHAKARVNMGRRDQDPHDVEPTLTVPTYRTAQTSDDPRRVTHPLDRPSVWFGPSTRLSQISRQYVLEARGHPILPAVHSARQKTSSSWMQGFFIVIILPVSSLISLSTRICTRYRSPEYF